jgi:hypothetical protein
MPSARPLSTPLPTPLFSKWEVQVQTLGIFLGEILVVLSQKFLFNSTADEYAS